MQRLYDTDEPCDAAVDIACDDSQKRPLELPPPEMHEKHAKTGEEHGALDVRQPDDRENGASHGSRHGSMPTGQAPGDTRRLVPDVAACARTLNHHRSDPGGV